MKIIILRIKGIIEIVDFVLQFSIIEILRETTYFMTMPMQ